MKPRYDTSSAFLMNIFFALEGSKLFIRFLLSLQLVLCRVAAVKSLTALIFNADYISLWYFDIKECILRIRKCLDSFSKQIKNIWVLFGLISVFETTALFNLPSYSIFLWLLLPDIIGSLMRLL